MNKRPWPLWTLSAAFFAMAVFFYFTNPMTTMMAAVLALLVANSLLLPTASRWLLLSLPLALMALLAWSDQSHQSIGFVALNSLILHPNVLKLFQDPKQRQWRSAHRFQKKVPVKIYPDIGDSYLAQSFNISSTGTFVELDNSEGVSEGDHLKIQFRFDGVTTINVDAVVIRKSPKNGRYPAGFGCRFVQLDQKEMGRIIRHLQG